MALENILKQATSQAKNLAQRMKRGAKNLATSNPLLLNLPFQLKGASEGALRRILPHKPYVSPRELRMKEEVESQRYVQASPKEQLRIKAFDYAPRHQIEKQPSAFLRTYLEPSPTDPRAEALRQQVLSSSGFRPAARKFLSTIPVGVSMIDPRNSGGAVGGGDFRFGAKRETPPGFNTFVPQEIRDLVQRGYYKPLSIQLQERMFKDGQVDPQARSTLLHEFLHQIPRPFLSRNDARSAFTRTSRDFTNFPFLSTIGQEYLMTGAPPPNPEEAFANMGTVLGQSAVLDPNVGRYFRGVFQQPGFGVTEPKVQTVRSGTLEPGFTPSKLRLRVAKPKRVKVKKKGK